MYRIGIGACVVLAVLLGGPILSAQQTTADATRTGVQAVVNLNTATAAQLETLPGVGPKLAARILEHRQKNGAFKKVEELMNIKGIGEKAFLKLKPLVTVTPPKS